MSIRVWLAVGLCCQKIWPTVCERTHFKKKFGGFSSDMTKLCPCVIFSMEKTCLSKLLLCYFIRHTLLREYVKMVLAEILSPANPLWLVYAMLPKLGVPTRLFVYHRLVLEAKVINHLTLAADHTSVLTSLRLTLISGLLRIRCPSMPQPHLSNC